MKAPTVCTACGGHARVVCDCVPHNVPVEEMVGALDCEICLGDGDTWCAACGGTGVWPDGCQHVSKAAWNAARDREPEDATHPCNSYLSVTCDCKGSCSCHWNETAHAPAISPPRPQQDPKPGSGPAIVDLLCEDLQSRAEAGRQKYGCNLQAHNGRDALVDAYQEALDLAMYLRQAIAERAQSPASAADTPREYFDSSFDYYFTDRIIMSAIRLALDGDWRVQQIYTTGDTSDFEPGGRFCVEGHPLASLYPLHRGCEVQVERTCPLSPGRELLSCTLNVVSTRKALETFSRLHAGRIPALLEGSGTRTDGDKFIRCCLYHERGR